MNVAVKKFLKRNLEIIDIFTTIDKAFDGNVEQNIRKFIKDLKSPGKLSIQKLRDSPIKLRGSKFAISLK